MRLTPAIAAPGATTVAEDGPAVSMAWDERLSRLCTLWYARSEENSPDSRLKSIAIFIGVCLAGPVTFFVVIFVLLNLLTRI